jgi:multidrug efflux pump subunit AcrA (membrane-fusion protein)
VRRLSPLLLAAMLAIGLPGCGGPASGGGEAADADSGAVVAVRAGVVSVQRFEDVVIAAGQWRSSGDVIIGAPFAGTVEALDPHVGDSVARGQRLGWLVTRESRSALRGAELLGEQASTATEHAEAERALALARRDLVRVPLVSPRAGIVTRRATEVGVEVSEGSELVTLTPREALVCEAHVPAELASQVRLGQMATLREDGAGEARRARVQRVLPSVSPGDQSRLVWLAPEASGPPPALDRFVTASIEVGAPHNALAVPDSAIVEDDLTGATRVAVIGADSTATWTTVTLGAHAGVMRELVSRVLAPGAQVIVVGQHGLPDHTRVRVTR